MLPRILNCATGLRATIKEKDAAIKRYVDELDESRYVLNLGRATRQCVERMDGQTHDVCTGMFTQKTFAGVKW
jgi:hypothetical protein